MPNFFMTKIIGILNCTPDSFYDGYQVGARHALPLQDHCIKHAFQLIEEGADWLDIGGESTRPGSKPVSIQEEIDRVLPAIREIRKKSSILLSIDTTKSQVAEIALQEGVQCVNDVSGLRADSEMISVIKKYKAKIILMHSRGTPETMQGMTNYKNIVEDIYNELHQSVQKAINSGIKKENILIDPGFGFAKTAEQNITLLKNLKTFKKMGFPLVVGVSRKSFIGKILNQPDPNDRLYGTLSDHLYASFNGADYLRVHDVKATKEVLKVGSVLNRKSIIEAGRSYNNS